MKTAPIRGRACQAFDWLRGLCGMGTRICAFALLAAPALLAQRTKFGVQVGGAATEFLLPGTDSARLCACLTEYSPAVKRFTAGPVAEVRVWRWWSVESGFLYKRVNYDFRSGWGFLPRRTAVGNTAANAWEIPLLVRRPLLWPRRWEISAGAGPVLRVLGQFRQQYWETVDDFLAGARVVSVRRVERRDPPEFRKRAYPGATVAVGAARRAGRFLMGPEVRYTRWLANANGSGFPPLQFRGSQVEALLRIRRWSE